MRPVGGGEPAARFRVGEVVRTRAASGDGHTRLPQYLAQRRGRIEAVHGPYPLADERARGIAGAPPQTLYSVVFTGAEIWGDSVAGALTIAADLWDAYLEPDVP